MEYDCSTNCCLLHRRNIVDRNSATVKREFSTHPFPFQPRLTLLASDFGDID